MLAAGAVMISEQAGVLAEVLAVAVEVAVDVNAMRSGSGIVQAMMSAVFASALVPRAHSIFLSAAAAQTVWTGLRH